MNISRPTIEVIHSPSGKKFTFRATNSAWSNEYQRRESFDSEVEAKAEGKKFIKQYDKEAKAIEGGEINRYHIMSTLTQHGKFTSRVKLSSNFEL